MPLGMEELKKTLIETGNDHEICGSWNKISVCVLHACNPKDTV